MQYALMIYSEPGCHEALPDAEREAVRAEFWALAEDPRCIGTVQLQPAETATCMLVTGGRTLMTAAGVPANPGGWLVTTARNRAIDRIRRERTLAGKIHLLPVPETVMDEFDDTVIKDERLELIFTCCHPALPLDGQVALTLRAVGGLETADGVTFIALLELNPDGSHPLQQLPAYSEFVENLKAWYAEPPVVDRMTVVGSYQLV